jgi:hypothetical protein
MPRPKAAAAAKALAAAWAIAAAAAGCAQILGIDEATEDPAIGCPATAAASISNFSSGSYAAVNLSGGQGWYLFYDQVGGNLYPPYDPAGVPRETDDEGGPCSGPGTLFQQGQEVGGAGVGFVAQLAPQVGDKHGYFNAQSYGYSGIRAWMKCTGDTDNVHFVVTDANTDFNAPMPMCTSYDNCVGHGVWGYTVPGRWWQKLELDFMYARQDSNRPGIITSTLDPTRLTTVSIKVDAYYDDQGTPSPNDFSCWLDDIHFY